MEDNPHPAKILVIQTAFLGDVVLATAVLEKLHQYFPDAQIDFVLRKGNEGVLSSHPFLHNLLVWDKKQQKIKNLFRLAKTIRRTHYDVVVNLHRHFSAGFLTVFSGAKKTIGFDKNPLSLIFSEKIKHCFSGKHETERNQLLIAAMTDDLPAKPKIYPSKADFDAVFLLKHNEEGVLKKYICIAPASMWATKQFPVKQWINMLRLPQFQSYIIYLLGAPVDWDVSEQIKTALPQLSIENITGKLSPLASAALMRDAAMNYVNDSAPMHLASAMDAPVTAIYCSTLPAFGYGPLSTVSHTVQVEQVLACRPCGIHGHRHCPQTHFNCAYQIDLQQLVNVLC